MPRQKTHKNTSFVNLFPEIVYDKSEISRNILDIWNNYRVVSFPQDISEGAYVYHKVTTGETLYQISNTYYGTIEFWWLIPLVNDAEDPTIFLEDVLEGRHPLNLPANTIRVLDSNFIPQILRQVMSYKNIVSEINRKANLSESEIDAR
jgi:hypothetical protein